MSDVQADLIDKYRAYHQALDQTPFSGVFADYNWGTLPAGLDLTWMIYAHLFQEYSTEIANSINDLINYERRLRAWESVIRGLDAEQTQEVLIEFIHPLATVTLNLPYAIRSRFIFAAAHLSHQVNRCIDGRDWKDDLPDNLEIYSCTADKHGCRWKAYARFKRHRERISDRSFQNATSQFRNSYNHRFPPHVEFGLSGFVSRQPGSFGDAKVYSFGSTEPLKLSQILPLLS